MEKYLIMTIFNIFIIPSAQRQTVQLLRSCGKTTSTDTALLIEVRNGSHHPKDNCNLTIQTTNNATFFINVESFTLGKGGNCSEDKPRLDFYTDEFHCFGSVCGPVKKSDPIPVTANNTFFVQLLPNSTRPRMRGELLIVATSLYRAPCRDGDWRCPKPDEYCINSTLRCDGHKNCPKGGDEDRWRCHPRQPMNAILMSFFMILLVLIIFVGLPSLVLLKRVNCKKIGHYDLLSD